MLKNTTTIILVQDQPDYTGIIQRPILNVIAIKFELITMVNITTTDLFIYLTSDVAEGCLRDSWIVDKHEPITWIQQWPLPTFGNQIKSTMLTYQNPRSVGAIRIHLKSQNVITFLPGFRAVWKVTLIQK